MTGGGEGSTSGPRMPPGTASLRHVSYTNGTVAAAQMDHGGSLNSKPSLEPAQSSAPAPKPFKKRYLAEQSQQQQQQQHQQHINAAVISGGPNSGTPTPTPSVTPTPPVSPVGADTARACEALLELSGGGGGGASGNSSGNRSPASGGTRSPPSREDTNGIDSKIALRKAVWKSVVETASKQKEKVSDKAGEGGTKKGTIRGQQIIDHIIENLIVKPTNCDSDAAANGLNNNADNDPASTDSDRIKASIYESLKNDLLKEKTHHGGGGGGSGSSRPGDLPFKSLRVDRARLKRPPVCEEATKLPIPKPTEAGTAVSAAASTAAVRVPTMESSSSADIMRLVSQNLAAPVSLGQSSVTITRTPRTQGAAISSHYNNQSSFKEHSQTSLTLTPAEGPSSAATAPALIVTTGGSGGLQPSLQHARGIILPHHPALQTNNSHHHKQQFSHHQPPHTTSSSAVILTPMTAASILAGHAAPPSSHLVVATSSRSVAVTDCGAVNLSMSRDESGGGRSCKGKRYQEFIEDGRIAVGGSRKRRSHRSGGGADGADSEEETALNLSQDSNAADASWKKTRHEMDATSNGVLVGGDWRGRKVATTAAVTKLSPPSNLLPSTEANDKAFSASQVVEGTYVASRGRRRLPAHTANS